MLVHVWSEFGRRPEENGSGTDHGAAGAGFVIGSQARRARWSASSRASRTLDEDDNLRNTSDFRGVYCALLEQWLGVDAGPIIPNASSFTRPALVADACGSRRTRRAASRQRPSARPPPLPATQEKGPRSTVKAGPGLARRDWCDLASGRPPPGLRATAGARARPAPAGFVSVGRE